MPKAAVLGSPISHSKSPLLHAAAYRALDLPWTYERYEVDEAAFDGFLAAHKGEFRGLSLTMPLKEVGYSRSELRSPAAQATLAVNTLIFGDVLQGHNTDVVGFVEGLRAAGFACPASATVLGTGATGRAAAYALHTMGVADVHVIGRREEALTAFRAWAQGVGMRVSTHDWAATAPDVEVTISATVAGATDDRVIPETPNLLFDAIYAPWPTAFAAKWVSAGGRVLGGLDLLVHQAAEQVLLMTRVHPDNRSAIVQAMYEAIRATEFRA